MFGHQAWNPEYHIRRYLLSNAKFPRVVAVQNKSFISNNGLYKHHRKYGMAILPPKNPISLFLKCGITYQKQLPNGRNPEKLGSKAFSLSTMNDLQTNLPVLTKSDVAMPLTEREQKESNAFLKQICLEKGGYFCFKDRDSSYMLNKFQTAKTIKEKNHAFVIREYNANKGDNHFDHARNTSLNSYYPAADLLKTYGLKAVRFGACSEKKSTCDSVTDYSFKIRNKENDITDLWLMSNCKFFVGPATGDWLLAMAFNKPVCLINSFPWPYINMPYRGDSLYMPKKMWIKDSKRFMKLTEMAELENKYTRNDFSRENLLEKIGIELIDNSKEEITNIIVEMNEKLNQSWDSNRDEIVQFTFNKYNVASSSKAKISTSFLETNPELI